MGRLSRLGEMFRYENLEIERFDVGYGIVSVVSPKTLYRMKKDTVGGKDRLDAQLPREKFGLGEN